MNVLILILGVVAVANSARAGCADYFGDVSESVAAAMLLEVDRPFRERIAIFKAHARLLEPTPAETIELEAIAAFRPRRETLTYGEGVFEMALDTGPRAQVLTLGVPDRFGVPKRAINLLFVHDQDAPRIFVFGNSDPRRWLREVDLRSEVARLGPPSFERALIEATWSPAEVTELDDRRLYSGPYRMPVNLSQQWGMTRSSLGWSSRQRDSDAYLEEIDPAHPFVTRRAELEYSLQLQFQNADDATFARHNRATGALGFSVAKSNQGLGLTYTVPRPPRVHEFLERLGPAFAHLRFRESDRATVGGAGGGSMWFLDFPATLEFVTAFAEGRITLFRQAPDVEDYAGPIVAFSLMPPRAHAWLEAAFRAFLARRQNPDLRREADRDMALLGRYAHRLLITYASSLYWDAEDYGCYSPEFILAVNEVPPERFGAADNPAWHEILARVRRAEAEARHSDGTGARFRRLLTAFDASDRSTIERFHVEMMDRVRQVRAASNGVRP